MADNSFYATGKRKTAVARVWLRPGSGKVQVNKMTVEDYFGGGFDYMQKISKPLALTDTAAKFDILATLTGGGKIAQTEALRHGISRALLIVDPEHRAPLKKAGFLTRDQRAKERKKYGQKGARARFQFSKR
ncbi:30S ribosomal protein S9 [Thiovibrio frasassiensis]|jgi:small subunit ribosomal protein S9|uniref:Small ribosomal subunit protein uS9 n=1 Tax=Thiovibrio frasassiensis TaxID=2984131 RepID=A0A9X4RMQ4_9BACT|nr:30S ribosomal protein S9 [Thiovibrio frasassiensis]MDG4476438.1 30S ribosomal protein S9 [Thiovibrio frasassiensis]